jgi:feruloyl esterase
MALGLAALALAAVACGDAAAATRSAERACAALAKEAIPDVPIAEAQLVDAKDGVPASCRVLGTIAPSIRFDLRMPLSGWNGKFYMAGCGGYCGILISENPLVGFAYYRALAHGYAVTTTDTGHRGVTPADGRWSANNPVAMEQWNWRAVHETARISKRLVMAYYRHSIAASYFEGCSNGGRQGLLEAQRFPADFNGIIAGAPGYDFNQLVPYWIWVTQSDTDSRGQPILRLSSVALIQSAVTKTCGRDGMVEDVAACRFDPAELICKAGGHSASCLTQAEVEVVKRWYAGPGGDVIARVMPGSEGSWTTTLAGPQTLDERLAQELLRYTLISPPPGGDYTVSEFSLEHDLSKVKGTVTEISATDPDLRAFARRGGKLILYHGLADSAIPFDLTVAYRSAVRKALGPQEASAMMRTFLIPGMNHCGAPGDQSPGVDFLGFDLLPLLDSWVRGGKAPTALQTTRVGLHRNAVWSQIVCSYPRAPRDKTSAGRVSVGACR